MDDGSTVCICTILYSSLRRVILPGMVGYGMWNTLVGRSIYQILSALDRCSYGEMERVRWLVVVGW